MLQFVGNMMEKENKAENQEMIKLFKDGGNYVSDENLKPMLKYINSNSSLWFNYKMKGWIGGKNEQK